MRGVSKPQLYAFYYVSVFKAESKSLPGHKTWWLSIRSLCPCVIFSGIVLRTLEHRIRIGQGNVCTNWGKTDRSEPLQAGQHKRQGESGRKQAP